MRQSISLVALVVHDYDEAIAPTRGLVFAT